MRFRLIATIAALLISSPARAEQLLVAVAANFAEPMREIAAQFERDSGHPVRLAFGATGKLYAQISHGAPYDVLLAADETTAEKLVEQQLAMAETRFTYATGRLVLWSAQPARVDPAGKVLAEGDFRRLAIASPAAAPYGAAAMDVLEALGLQRLSERLVRGESITHAYQFVASGNAELGFVARSQVYRDGRWLSGSGWEVPAELHRPLHQQAVQLSRSRDNPAASALLAYLRQPRTRALIASYGYGVSP